MSSRLEVLEAMLSADPENVLARYGLAMELLNGGRAAEAVESFRRLLEKQPGYAAAYFHGGRALEAADRIQEAREWYEKGIEVTAASGDLKTRAELQAALDILG
jgi:tetratricopeptide (TPR) repeat protein